jgi:hypothetical protein
MCAGGIQWGTPLIMTLRQPFWVKVLWWYPQTRAMLSMDVSP